MNGILNVADGSALSIGTGTNNGTLTANTAGGDLVLLNFSSNAVTINSVIADNSTASTLMTGGSGSIIVTVANTYSGVTSVGQGALEVGGAAGALANTSHVTVNTGGTLLMSSSTTAIGGRINDGAAVTLAGGAIRLGIDGIDESMGGLTLSGDSIIDFGTLNGSNQFRFSDSTSLWASGTMLNILGYTAGSDHLYFGTVTGSGVNTAQLGQINFYSGDSVGSGFLGTGSYLANGEVGLVPEPSTVAMMELGTLALIGFRRRRPIERIPGSR
jgi:autotransporter-associated beta strand protein